MHALAPLLPLMAGSVGSLGPTGSVGVVPLSPAIPWPAMISHRAISTVAPSTITAMDDPPGCVASAAFTLMPSTRVTPTPPRSRSGTTSASAVIVVLTRAPMSSQAPLQLSPPFSITPAGTTTGSENSWAHICTTRLPSPSIARARAIPRDNVRTGASLVPMLESLPSRLIKTPHSVVGHDSRSEYSSRPRIQPQPSPERGRIGAEITTTSALTRLNIGAAKGTEDVYQ